MNIHMEFWWSKFMVELQASALVVLFVILVVLIRLACTWIKQSRCKHYSYRENRSCQAICNKCGKDLGFIGTVRKARQQK